MVEDIIEKALINFHRLSKSIRNRHENRQTLEIKDEYDVQDLLGGILRLFVDDVRPEDYTPEYAGGRSRIDFHIPDLDMYIETKMTRETLADKKIGDELLIDVGRYREMCNVLICFIYDPDSRLENPFGLVKDLEKLSNVNLEVRVIISPL